MDDEGRVLDVHALRHTTGTWLTSNPDIPLRTAQEIMRHSDIRLTTQTYTDPEFLDKRAAVESLPALPITGERCGPQEEGGSAGGKNGLRPPLIPPWHRRTGRARGLTPTGFEPVLPA